MKEKTIKWIKCAGIRAIKTVAQTAVSLIGVGTVMSDINWSMLASAMAEASYMIGRPDKVSFHGFDSRTGHQNNY